MSDAICEIDWEQVRVSPFQPRRTFSEEELEELAASIRTVGLIHPPVVRRVESCDKLLYYELIAGERRWRAAKLAGLHTLKVIVRTLNDEDAAKSTLIENIQRVDLDPIEMAEALKQLIAIFGMTQEEVSEKVGKKRSTVANYLRLLSLPSSIKESLSGGSITMGHAKAILSLSSRQLQEQLNDVIIQKNLNVRDTEAQCKKMMRSQKGKRAPAAKEQHLEETQDLLQQALQTKVNIEPLKAGGRIIIHYFSDEELERVTEHISKASLMS